MKADFEHLIPTLLVVDDNPKNLQIVALILRELNYKLIIATDGKSAVDLVERARPDLILLDVMMPGMDGFDTCKMIKSNPANDNIPVIFLTALSEKVNTVKGFEVGGVDYMVKPFNKEELVTRIKTHLELKFTRDKLQKTTDNLIELNSIKDKLFSIIGHDLRSPVGSLKMMLDFLSKNPAITGNPAIKGNFDIMTQTADELYSLLENLLGWAKSQSGNLNFESEFIDLPAVSNGIFLLYKGYLQQKKLNFEQHIEEGMVVFTDMNMLKTVLRNLVSNAIKFSPEGGTVTLSAKKQGDLIHISISDTGVGILPENIPKLFDEKQHFSTYGTNKESGSGLGLNLCHSFIQNNNGRIWVESEVGKGSSFTFELPATNGK